MLTVKSQVNREITVQSFFHQPHTEITYREAGKKYEKVREGFLPFLDNVGQGPRAGTERSALDAQRPRPAPQTIKGDTLWTDLLERPRDRR